jgi:CheY-like chemotaxis protein
MMGRMAKDEDRTQVIPGRRELMANAAAARKAPPEQPVRVSAAGVHRGRVLLVDDIAVLAQAVALVMRAQGFEVVTAGTGEEALARLRGGERFETVVSDVSMPGMDGLALLAAVREVNPDVPVILMTGGPLVETAIRAVELGALRYMTKPVDPEKLQRAVGQAVLLHRLASIKREALARPSTEAHATVSDMTVAFGPIVHLQSRTLWGYEAQAVVSRGTPARFDAAKLGLPMRELLAQTMDAIPMSLEVVVPVNLADLTQAALTQFDAPLTRYADRIFLCAEANEALVKISRLGDNFKALRRLGYRIMLGGFAQERNTLFAFMRLRPDVIRFDVAAHRSLDAVTQRELEAMCQYCHSTHIPMVADGIGSVADEELVQGVGVDLMQGPRIAARQAMYSLGRGA